MDTEVSFFTSDRKVLVTRKVKKKENSKRKFDRVERRKDVFLEIFRSSTATRIPREESFFERNEKACKGDFLVS